MGDREFRHLPLVFSNPSGERSKLPLTVRYMWALRRALRAGHATAMQILDFHRIEPVLLFSRDRRPKNLTTHMNVHNLRNRGTDILWKYLPGVYERLERRMVPRFDRIYAVQQAVAEAFAQDHPVIANRFIHLPPMVDTSVYRLAEDEPSRKVARDGVNGKFALPRTGFILTFVGRLDLSKDPLLLLKAFRQVSRREPDAHLVLVGDGNLRSEVERAVQEDGLQGRVTLLGARAPQEVAEILQASDAFVMSSAYEGLPIAMLEALASGVPVVSTDVGDVARVLKDGVNGFVCRVRTAEQLATGINDVLTRLDAMRGAPCANSIAPYRAEAVLQTIYENYRKQNHAATARLAG
jgi:glycosyltransferase involved in cell wall biosynthesis